MTTKRKKPRVIFEATPETIERVKAVAHRIDQTVSGTVRRAVVEFLDRMEKDDKDAQ